MIVAVLTALVIFSIAIAIPKLIVTGTVTSLIVTQSLELALALAAIVVLGKGRFRDYGFCRPRNLNKRSLAMSILLAVGVGAIASLTIGLTGVSGNPLVKSLTLPMIILLVWFSSSIVEEVFTRGFLQGHLAPYESITVVGPISLAAFVSALFFGAMHLVLFLSGADCITIAVILGFTFSLGLLAAHQRSRTSSLVPPILVHGAGNIGGFVGGILFVIIHVIRTGTVPGQ